MTRAYLLGVLTGIALSLLAYGVRIQIERIDRLEAELGYVVGFLSQTGAIR